MRRDDVSKLLLINKPKSWTSFDVVKKTRGLLKQKYKLKKLKVGHAGTLDPLASGLLIICSGVKTKEIQMFERLDKVYIATIQLGCVTDSFDAETPEKNHKSYIDISIEDVKKNLLKFMGEQEQIPPIYSAIKMDGERLYKKARRGDKNIKLKSRTIQIKNLQLLDFQLPFIKISIQCSKGTYIRSLAHDIGRVLGCGAYLKELIRTQIGDYKLQDAIDISELTKFLYEDYL